MLRKMTFTLQYHPMAGGPRTRRGPSRPCRSGVKEDPRAGLSTAALSSPFEGARHLSQPVWVTAGETSLRKAGAFRKPRVTPKRSLG